MTPFLRLLQYFVRKLLLRIMFDCHLCDSSSEAIVKSSNYADILNVRSALGLSYHSLLQCKVMVPYSTKLAYKKHPLFQQYVFIFLIKMHHCPKIFLVCYVEMFRLQSFSRRAYCHSNEYCNDTVALFFFALL